MFIPYRRDRAGTKGNAALGISGSESRCLDGSTGKPGAGWSGAIATPTQILISTTIQAGKSPPLTGKLKSKLETQRRLKMRRQQTVPAAFNRSAMTLRTRPSGLMAAGRLFGLDFGDWSMVLLGFVMSGLLLLTFI
jgi:hypothetical protein